MAFFPEAKNPWFGQGDFQIDGKMTPAELLVRRNRLARNRPQYGKARYVGEGIGQLFTGINEGVRSTRLDRAETEGREGAQSDYDYALEVFGGGGGGGGFVPQGWGGPAPVATSALPDSDQGVADDTMRALGKQPIGETESDFVSLAQENIFPGESGGDYDAIFGFSQRPGGQFAGVKPTEMTVAELLEFQDPSGPYGQWVKGQVGRVATPAGAYQGVGTTIRAAVDAGVLDPNQKFDKAAQDRFGEWVYNTQGSSAWDGWGKGSGGGGQPAQGGRPAQGSQQSDMMPLYKALSNPWLNQGQRDVLTSMIQQRTQANDPMRALDMQYKQAQIAKANRPSDPLVTVNTGNEVGRYLYGKDAGLPAGYRLDTQTGEASPIPGGPQAVETAESAVKEERKSGQQKLKLGTTLTSLGLNIDEINDGGWPVTGPWGDFRRLGPVAALTGADAKDFGNRTNQITDSAALGEIQNMRDNSKTGGAVGNLTDGERIAIGNAVTALNNSTSATEYLRAATAYRELALDLAYGEGMWAINDDGDVVAADAPTPAATAAPAATGGDNGWTDVGGVRVRRKQ